MIRRLAAISIVAAFAAALGCAGSRAGEQAHRPADAEAPAAAVAAGDRQVDLLEAAMAFIEPFEGRRHVAYEDSTGHATVGVGFNLDRPGAAADLARLLPGVSHRGLRRGRHRLTDGQVDTLFRHDVARAIEATRRHVPNLDELPHDAQLVLIDMSFNLGSLRAWRDLKAAVAAADFDAAAAAMHDSRWRAQTGRRARQLIAIMDSLG